MKKLSLRRTTTKEKNVSADNAQRSKITFGQSITLLLFATVILFASSGYYWYTSVFSNPDRIMSDMLDKSLQTTSVSRTVSQSQGDSSVSQKIYLAYSPGLVTRSITDLSEVSNAGRTNVTTETIGTRSEDFVRYTGIKIGNNTDSSRYKDILNTWGVRQANPSTGQDVTFLSEALFVAVPFGNLNNDQRAIIKQEIAKNNLYQTVSSEKISENGRPTLKQTVDIDPKALVTVLGKYVDITGVGNKADLDPANYEGANKIRVVMNIDMLSRHLRTIDFSGSGRSETYTAYNLTKNVPIPAQTIDVNELQSRLSALESQTTQTQQQAQ